MCNYHTPPLCVFQLAVRMSVRLSDIISASEADEGNSSEIPSNMSVVWEEDAIISRRLVTITQTFTEIHAGL